MGGVIHCGLAEGGSWGNKSNNEEELQSDNKVLYWRPFLSLNVHTELKAQVD